MPDPDPAKSLEGSLLSFNGMVAGEGWEGERVLTPQDFSTFMESLGEKLFSHSILSH